jgi:thioredoxin 1
MAVLHLTEADFQENIAKGVTLVDFWAPWCGPCRMIAPILEKVEAAVSGKAKIGKVNVDENEELARQFSVMSIPTLLLFKDGKLADKMVGVPQNAEESLKGLIEKHLPA